MAQRQVSQMAFYRHCTDTHQIPVLKFNPSQTDFYRNFELELELLWMFNMLRRVRPYVEEVFC